MKRNLFVLVLVLCFAKLEAQEKLMDVLKALSVTDKKISYKCLESKKTYPFAGNGHFSLDKSPARCCDFGVLNMSQFKTYSIFGIFSRDQLKDKPELTFRCHSVLLFDNAQKRIFLIEYAFDGFPVTIQKRQSIIVSADFSINIQRIVELDKNLVPMGCLKFEPNEKVPYGSEVFKKVNGVWLKGETHLDLPTKDGLTYDQFLSLIRTDSPERELRAKCTTNDNMTIFRFETL